MWTLAKGNEFLPNTSLKQLKSMYHSETKAKPKLRLLGALHRKQGQSIDEIAYLLNTSRDTVYGWLRRFTTRGIDGKDSIKQSGRPAQLTVKQRKALVRIIEQGPSHNRSGLWSTKELRAVISKKFKRTYVKQHVWRLLVSLGFSMQRPRKRHYLRPSDEELAQFKKKLGRKHAIIIRKDLLWARKMRQPLA